MKKIASLFLAGCMSLALIATITSCGGNHEHTYKTEWASDSTHHWHACEGEKCSEVSDKSEHTWNKGKITTPATTEQDGIKTYECGVCGSTKNETVKYNKWVAYFDYNNYENVTVGEAQTDGNGDRYETIICIDGKKWERYFTDTNIDFKYYDVCVVSFDGENKYINGTKVDNCTVTKEAFFSFIDFSDKEALFSETSEGRYELQGAFSLYGYEFSNVVVLIENDLLKHIEMKATRANSTVTFEYDFTDWGTTVISE